VLSLALIALSTIVGASAAEPEKRDAPGNAAVVEATTADSPRPANQTPLVAPEPRPTLLVPLAHTAALIAGMRGSLSFLWPDHFNPLRFRENASNFRVAWTSFPDYDRRRRLFESDGDPWLINGVGHGLFGSEVYQRMRRCGHDPMAAFAATAIVSTAWEYGIEAFHQRPSAIDLVWAPLGGALIGEGRYQLFRLIERSERGGAVLRRAGMILLDPFGEAERSLFATGC
jgi:hypothetical protein